MKNNTVVKTYGIRKGWHKGKEMYFIAVDGQTRSSCFARPEFAIKKAEEFAKDVYKDFTRTYELRPEYDESYHFEFKYDGYEVNQCA
jgi:hypothetical protein